MSEASPARVRQPSKGRSRLTNDPAHPPAELDYRSSAARRWRNVYAGLSRALKHEPSAYEQILLRRATSLVMRAEALDGADTKDDTLVRVSGALLRALDALGIAAAPPAEPEQTLEEYLAERR